MNGWMNKLRLMLGYKPPLEEKDIVGTYEWKWGAKTSRWFFLDNGIMETYSNGKKGEAEYKWSLVHNEIHTKQLLEGGCYGAYTLIYKINPDNSITFVGDFRDGKRFDLPNDGLTLKKIDMPIISD